MMIFIKLVYLSLAISLK